MDRWGGPRKVKVSVILLSYIFVILSYLIVILSYLIKLSCQGQIYAQAYIVSFAVVKTILLLTLTPRANIVKLFNFITYE
jgi:hypothetical protein